MKKTVIKYSLCITVLIALLIVVFAFSTSAIEEKISNSPILEQAYYFLNEDGSLTETKEAYAATSYQELTYQELTSGSKNLACNNSDSDSMGWWSKGNLDCSASASDSWTYTIDNTTYKNAFSYGRIFIVATVTNWTYSLKGQTTSKNITISNGCTNDVSPNAGETAQLVNKEHDTLKTTTFTITISCHAESHDYANRFSGKSISCSCSCSGTANITVYFLRPTLTYTNNNSDKGSITNSGSRAMDINTTVSSTATAKAGNYFVGWEVSGVKSITSSNSPSITSIVSHNIDVNNKAEYVASFAEITGSNWATTTYTYNGSQQGPRANDISGYSVTHLYTGTLTNGSNYSSSTMPTNAGTYNYTATVKYDSYTMGTRASSQFTIRKDPSPTYDLKNPSNIYFGQAISSTGISATQPKNSQNADLTVAGTWEWKTASAANNGTTIATSTLFKDGRYTYYYRFTPTDTINYNIIEKAVTFTVSRAFRVSTYYAGGIAPNGNSTDSVNSAVTSIVNNKAVVTLTAYPDTSNNYFLLGWKRGGSWNSSTEFANNSIVYTMSDTSEAQYTSTFQAVFMQYYVNDGVVQNISSTYTGSARTALYTFDLSDQDYPYSISAVTYNGGSAPIGVGSYDMAMTVTNTALSKTAKVLHTTFNITARTLTVTAIKNNAYGWTQTPQYTIETPGVASGAVQYYMYSTNGGSSWTRINVTPTAAAKCPILFEPSVTSGLSYVTNYTFKAVHETYGNGSPKAVGSTDSTTVCKVDTYVPQITVAYAGGYSGQWVNTDISFTITVQYGGSGALCYFSIDGVNWTNTELVGLTQLGQTLPNDVTTATYTWTRTEEHDAVYNFQIRSGTNIETQYKVGGSLAEFDVKIDKSAPVIESFYTDKTANANGWIDEIATVSFVASDSNLTSNSGFKSITVNFADAALNLNNGGTLQAYNNNCILTVPDCRTYVITGTDNAGNVTVVNIQRNVDVITPSFGYDSGSYAVGEWDTEAEFRFAITAGGSGVRLSYSTDGVSYTYFDGTSYNKESGNEAGHQQVVHLVYTFTAEQIQDYYFKVECAAGFSSVTHFGTVKVDTYAPTIEQLNLDDFTQYLWDSGRWTTDTLNLQIKVYDELGIYKSGIASVQMDGEDWGYNAETSVYDYNIIKCTLHTLTVTDEAGNYTTYEYRYKVDQGIPEFDYEAKIGTTSTDYTFAEDSWLSSILYGNDAFVRFAFTMKFSPSGVKVQYCVTGAGKDDIWLEFSSSAFMIMDAGGNLTPLALTGGYIFEPGNEGGLEQNIVVYVDIVNEQDNPFKIRMITGSGKIVTPDALGQLRLDFTSPSFVSAIAYEDSVTGAKITTSELLNTWRPNHVNASFSLYDATSQVNTVEIRKYNATATVAYPYDTQTAYSSIEYVLDNDVYSFVMTEYAKYVFVIVDKAGNVTSETLLGTKLHPSRLPKIDTLSDFSISVDATYTSNNSEYVSGTWIFDPSENVRFDFSFIVAGNAFGPSGALVEFSTNGGNSWVSSATISGTTQAVANNGTMAPYMIASVTQMRTYLFRIITGAGKYDIYDNNGVNATTTVNKEVVNPNLNITARVGSENYTHNWVNASVNVTVDFAVGISGATLQLATSDSATATFAQSDWQDLQRYQESNSATFTLVLQNTTDEIYYYFRYASVSGRCLIQRTDAIRIDKDQVSVTIAAYLGTQLYDESWTAESITLKITELVCGPSGHTTYYQTSDIDAKVWSALSTSGISAEDALTIDFNSEKDYIFQVESGSGIVARSNIVTIRSDIIVPTFSISISGTELTEGVSAANLNWWITNVAVTYENCFAGNSGYTAELCYYANGRWSDWSGDAVAYDATTLRDVSNSGGGTQRNYKFRLLNGAGISSVERDFRNNVVDEENPAELVKIDIGTYSVSVTQYVGIIRGTDYASVNGNANIFNRGQTVATHVTMQEGYSIKALQFDTGDSYKNILNNTQWAVSFSVEIQGENVSVLLYAYKTIALSYDNLEQVLQNNTITAVSLEVTEEGFAEIFGTLAFDVTYGGSSEVPQEIGVYAVSVAAVNENYLISNSSATMTITYFSGSGEFDDNPYFVGNYKDLTYIDAYMNKSAEYDYLGDNRLNSIFHQSKDFTLPTDFTPISGDGCEFGGSFNGGNFRIFYEGEYTATDDFGLFLNLADGGSIMAIGLHFEKLILDGVSDISVGLIVAKANVAFVSSSYVTGEIVIVNADNVNIGGVCGIANGTSISRALSDVIITGTGIDNSNIGGIVGKGDNLTLMDDYSIGNITLIDYNTEDSYVGMIAGYVSGTFTFGFGTGEEAEYYPSVYLLNNLIINRVLINIGIGVADAVGEVSEGIAYDEFTYFLEDETFLGTDLYGSGYDRTVGALVKNRFNDLGLTGVGTADNPIEVDSLIEFAYITKFPWACFVQTKNLDMSGDAFAPIFAALAETVFSGVYDGGNKSIMYPELNTTDNLVGIFPQVKGGTIKDLNLVDFTFNVSSSALNVFAAGVVGRALSGTVISGVVVSGTLTVNSDITASTVFAGGIAGDFSGAEVSDCVSLSTVNVETAFIAVAGGVIGQASGGSGELNNIVSLAKVAANFVKSGYVGNAIGYIYQEIAGNGIYNVQDNTYVNGRLSETSVGVSESGSISGILASTYERTVGVIDISDIISSLYPFSDGTGTASDPFIISTYAELLRVSDYMYASFLLNNDITIGDYDNDGVVDDDYAYDFKTLGGGAVFTGSFDGGDGKFYSIFNLTDSLFEINAGIVKNLTLNAYYYVTDDTDVVGDNARAKLYDGSGAVVFGAVAKYNRTGGNIKLVTVDGIIRVETSGRARVKVGGIIGVAEGGAIRSTICAATIDVKSFVSDIGGIVGSVEGNTTIEDSELQYNLTIIDINAEGGLINAGLLVGAVRSEASIKAIAYYTELTINRESVGTEENPQYVGLNVAGISIIFTE